MTIFKEKVKVTLEKYQMIRPGDLVVVAVSGGPDSLVLLHVLKELKDDLACHLHVAHLNHGLRGAEAKEEAHWVAQIARKWQLPCTVAKVDVATLARKKGLSLQAAGHQARQKFFLELARKIGAHKIAVGHQADDQAETVLMHFLVGAGLQGLQGLRPCHGPLIRPLLFLRRSAIEAYCQAHALEPRRDPSNAQTVYLRNRLRLEIIPQLEVLNPNLIETLNRTAAILQVEEDFLEKETEKNKARFIQKQGEKISLSLKGWQTLHQSLQRRLIRKAYQQVGPAQGLAFAHVLRVQEFLRWGEVGKVCQLPGKINVEKTYGQVLFSKQLKEKLVRPPIEPRCLSIPGETVIPESGQIIIAEIKKGQPGKSRPQEIYLPEEKLKEKVWVRARQPGDRFTFPGLKGTKKIKDFLREQKIPWSQREQIAVVTVGAEIVWLPGLAVTSHCLQASEVGSYLVLRLADFSSNI